MSETSDQRRLAAILAADVVDYTRAMGTDESGTLARLQAVLRDVIRPAVAGHDGRIFKEMGDGILAEFPSAVGAAQCAAAIQSALAEAEAPLQLRIGLHLGDVIVTGEDLFGDGVNLAARLQAEADPGGVVASAAFRQHVEGRSGLKFSDLGSRSLKNVAAPVQVFALNRTGNAPSAAAMAAAPARRRRLALPAPVLAGLALAILAAFAAWLGQDLRGLAPTHASAAPAVAVLPFDNLSPDPEQAYFAEGLAEDLITDLSKLTGVQVVSRTSSFAVDRGLSAAEIGTRLNAGYIVTGSVRRAGDRLRITASLVDPMNDTPLWAERFDGSPADVFGFQDQITGQIIEALRVQLTPAEQKAVTTRGTDNPAAYDAYLRGLRLVAARRRLDTEANEAAQAAFEDAIRLDPDYAQAYAGLGWTKWLYYETINYYGSPDEAFRLAEKSLTLADNALAHRTLAKRHFSLLLIGASDRKIDQAVAELEAARRLQPNDPDVLADLASALPFAGRPEEAVSLIQQAMEHNPDHPAWYFSASGVAYLLTEQPQLAIRDLERWSAATPNWPTPHLFVAAAYGLAGQTDLAEKAFKIYTALRGYKMTIYAAKRTWPMALHEEEIFLRGLKAAGVKETPG